MQSVPISTEVVSYNPAHGDVYSIHYVIKFVSDFLRVLRFPPPIKMLFIQLPYDHDHDGPCMKYKYKMSG